MDESSSRTIAELGYNIEQIRLFIKRLESQGGEQNLLDGEAMIRKSFFFLRSLALSPASVSCIRAKYVAVRGLYLTIKKLNKRNMAKFQALRDTCYLLYLRWNVVDRLHADVFRIKHDLIKLNLDKSHSGGLTRNPNGPPAQEKIRRLRHKLV